MGNGPLATVHSSTVAIKYFNEEKVENFEINGSKMSGRKGRVVNEIF